ncbi:YkvA family protein [Zhaonella formicivorans]|uniref:YkvA family protein n=1 Tax=Zhaonella formicivorans TaxID=2528593 RepID=UPI0010CF60C8|nr:DUF1232 domain-containing protein [Zhaonella formicivorans]
MQDEHKKTGDFEPVKVELLDEGVTLKDLKKAQDFFDKIRKQISDWAEKKGGRKGKMAAEVILFAPDLFMLLVRLARDKRIPAQNKAVIFAGITYFISPVDFFPEALLGPLGFADDVLLAVHIINLILNSNRVAVLENWSGSGDLIVLLQEIAARAESMVNTKVYRKILNFIAKRR